MMPEDRLRRYVDVALTGAVDEVAAAGRGVRSDTLNRKAYSLGRLAADACLSESEARAALVRAAVAAGMPESEAQSTFKSGWQSGLKKRKTINLADLDSTHRTSTPARPPAPPPPEDLPNRPPETEVARLWAACVPVTGDVQTSAWLTTRGFGPDVHQALIELQDLARAIPLAADCPKWAGMGNGETWGSWPAKGYTLAIPLFDADGNMRSVKARLTGPPPWQDAPKALDPKGHQVKGLVMANPPAVELLQGSGKPVDLVVITEGVPDWFTWSTEHPIWPVFGHESGFWTRAHADKVPDGVTVYIMAHNDEAGDKYAAGIVETFKGRRVNLRRGDVRMVKGE